MVKEEGFWKSLLHHLDWAIILECVVAIGCYVLLKFGWTKTLRGLLFVWHTLKGMGRNRTHQPLIPHNREDGIIYNQDSDDLILPNGKLLYYIEKKITYYLV